MGCRPSRRAVACVRVAGEAGQWGVGSSTRPSSCDTGDGGVRLRRRSSNKQSAGEGKGQRNGGGKPKDRYSAPPTDRVFPPHSCTSATYEHGCCGTSRITLRLSKNGSTLEIEKCDFDHGLKTCKKCNPTTNAPPLHQVGPWRTQSAPNLSAIPSLEEPTLPPPIPPRAPMRHVVISETHPPPKDPDKDHPHLLILDAIDSPPESFSVMTATKVEANIESSETSPPKSSAEQLISNIQTNYSFVPESPVHTKHKITYLSKMFGERTVSTDPLNFSPDSLSEDALSLHSSMHSLQSLQLNHIERESSYLLRNADKISHTSWTTHQMKEAVDLTTFYHINNHLFIDDLDMNHAPAIGSGTQEENGLGQNGCAVSNGESAAEVGWSEKVCSNARLSFDCFASPSRQDHQDSSYGEADRIVKPKNAETDYRVRTLNAEADKDKLVYNVDVEAVENTANIDVFSNESQILVSIHSSHIGEFSDVPEVTGSIGAVEACMNGSIHCAATSAGHCGELPKASFASSNNKKQALLNYSATYVNGRLERRFEESTDTSGCESEEDEENMLGIACLELAPAYVHADFKNDFEDLFDDSSPEFDAA